MHMQPQSKCAPLQRKVGEVLQLKQTASGKRENKKERENVSEKKRTGTGSSHGGEEEALCGLGGPEATLDWCYWELDQTQQEVREVCVCTGHGRTGEITALPGSFTASGRRGDRGGGRQFPRLLGDGGVNGRGIRVHARRCGRAFTRGRAPARHPSGIHDPDTHAAVGQDHS